MKETINSEALNSSQVLHLPLHFSTLVSIKRDMVISGLG